MRQPPQQTIASYILFGSKIKRSLQLSIPTTNPSGLKLIDTTIEHCILCIDWFQNETTTAIENCILPIVKLQNQIAAAIEHYILCIVWIQNSTDTAIEHCILRVVSGAWFEDLLFNKYHLRSNVTCRPLHCAIPQVHLSIHIILLSSQGMTLQSKQKWLFFQAFPKEQQHIAQFISAFIIYGPLRLACQHNKTHHIMSSISIVSNAIVSNVPSAAPSYVAMSSAAPTIRGPYHQAVLANLDSSSSDIPREHQQAAPTFSPKCHPGSKLQLLVGSLFYF